MQTHPETVILTVTRKGAQRVNDCALQAFHPHYPPRTILFADIESNPENSSEGTLKAFDQLKPIARNVCPDIDFVNGMNGYVERWDARAQAVRVRTDTGRLVAVWPYTDVNLGNATYYPLRAG